jgi:hypothetical protein
MSRWGAAEEWDISRIRVDRFATTDDQGRFVFDNVPPGDVWVSHAGGKKNPPNGQIIHGRKMTLIEVQSGKPTIVQVGGKGRPIIGRLPTTVAEDPELKLVWQDSAARSVGGRFHRSDLPQPPHDPNLTPQEHSKRYFQWQKSTAEGRYRLKYGWNEEFDVNPDGTFRIDDVLPGKYEAYFDYQVREGRQRYFGPSLIAAFAQFEVKEMPGERSDEPIDVGLVQVKVRPRLLDGKPAPDFAVNRLDDGKEVKLSDFKGKHVVLKLWYNWNKLEEDGPAMKKAFQVIKNDPQFVMLNISFTDTNATYKKSLVEGGVPGIHATAKHETFPNAYTSWPFEVCLIDPAGKVEMRDVRLEELERRLAQVMLER